MRFLICGLGSMGKRRIRCLHALGCPDVAGFDIREDRRREAASRYGIATYGEIGEALASVKPEAMIISVPPDVHHEYMTTAIRYGIPFFVEASVVDTQFEQIKAQLKATGLVGAPSATLLFHPAIRIIKDVLVAGKLGKVSNILFHSGQYLPDWHTYEQVSDFYVSNPITGGAREITPFELTWLTHLFGFPKGVCGHFRKTIDIKGAESIEDTYNFLMDYGDHLASITVDVVSRFATRRLLINGDEGQLLWDWNQKHVAVFIPETGSWQEIPYEAGAAATGYNPNIGEQMYIDELKAFLDAVAGKAPFVNSLEADHRVLKLLYTIEASDREATYREFAGGGE